VPPKSACTDNYGLYFIHSISTVLQSTRKVTFGGSLPYFQSQRFQSTDLRTVEFFSHTPRSLPSSSNMGTSTKPAPDVSNKTPPPPYDLDGPSANSQSKTTHHLDADHHLHVDLEDGQETNIKPPGQTAPARRCWPCCGWIFLTTLVVATVL
jgi:hypothetical protein